MLTTTFSREGKDVTWTYRGVIKSATTMVGTLEMSNEPGRRLKWTAAKKWMARPSCCRDARLF
jgi:hypothetical protein